MKSLLALSLISLSSILSAQEIKPTLTFKIRKNINKPDTILFTKDLEEPSIFTVVEQMPEFPGGTRALMNFLSSNIKYPATAREEGDFRQGICDFCCRAGWIIN